MIHIRYCDICGRSETEFLADKISNSDQIVRRAGGLFLCQVCDKKLTKDDFNQDVETYLDELLVPLVGKSAGAICRTLGLPFIPPYESVIEAASAIAYDQDLYMSAWTFETQWQNGTTVWRDPEDHAIAHVTPDLIVKVTDN